MSDNEQALCVPCVHLNGSGSDTLLKEYREVVEAFDELQLALQRLTFHSRDYYVLGDDAWKVARDAETARRAMVSRCRDEYRQIMVGIRRQIRDKERQREVR
jgi:hypothetical protein